MSSTNFTVFGYLGDEVVIDGSVETNLLFAVADAKKTLLAWYGFRSIPARWHADQFGEYHQPGVISFSGDPVTPTLDTNFAGSFTPGNENSYPGPFSINAIIPRSGFPALARLAMSDDKKLPITHCVLTVPGMKPVGLMMFFDLRILKKRRTIDLEKDGGVGLIVVEKFSPNALKIGPHPTALRVGGFRD